MRNRLTVILPPRAKLYAGAIRAADLRTPALELMWACGDAVMPFNEQLGFDLQPKQLSLAAITRQMDCKDAAGSHWMRADPAWLRAELADARMMACGDLSITEHDRQLVEKSLRPLFGDAGFEFSAPTASRWYVRAPLSTALPSADGPDLVLGDLVEPHLPQSNNASKWRALLNEAQIILHNMPLNNERAAQGLPPVNSLWFHGGGALPNVVNAPFTTCFSADACLLGLASLRMANVAAVDAWSEFVSTTPEFEHALLDLRQLHDAQELDLQIAWPILEAVKAKRLNDVTWHFVGDQARQFRAKHRWRFWRAPKALHGK